MAKPSYSLAQIVGQLNSGTAWDGNDITYSFPTSTEGNFNIGENAGYVPMSGFQLGMARAAYDLWDDLIAPNLTETTTGWDAVITMAYSSTSGSYAKGYVDQSQIWFDTKDTDMVPQNVYYSQPGFGIGYIHEIGHALGLDHPGPYNGGDANLTFDNKAVYSQDTLRYTVMSYFGTDDDANGDPNGDAPGDPNGYVDVDPGASHSAYINGAWRPAYASTPMLHDIAAIQWMYGADLKTRTNDDTYGFNARFSGEYRDAFDFEKNEAPIVTIWDAGGTDTLDLSRYTTRQVVDLNPGAYSSIGDVGLTNNVAMSIAVDSYGRIKGLHSQFSEYGIVNYIEHAKGGSGSDEITGNAAKNWLEGNDGNDKLYGAGGDDWLRGGAGNDELLGGAGNDLMQGGAGNDIYYVEEAYDAVSEMLPNFIGDAGGIDEIRTWWTYHELPQYVENLTYLGKTLTSQDFTGVGNGLGNVIKGGFANDTLRGMGGNDLLEGGAGDDTLDGGTQNDTMRGGAGNDTYVVDTAGDRVIEYTTNTVAGRVRYSDQGGIDTIQTSLPELSLAGYRYVENLTYTGTGTFKGIGNDLDNVMRGGSGNDTLEGAAGNDSLFGGGGRNRLVGGAGNDTYHLGSPILYGPSTIVEDAGGGTDRVVFHAISNSILNFHTLADNVENLTFTGNYNARGTGNGLNNILIGNAGENTLRGLGGNDTLDGGDGFDTLIGGTGNDTYRVSSTIYQRPDTIVEDANAGIDTVIYTPVSSLSSITPSYTLGDNLENLTLRGALDADGVGNALNNVIIGNAQSNTLRGLGGNDKLDGGLGFDSLEGGEGDDTLVGTYQYSPYGVDVMDGGNGNDTADFSGHGRALWIDLGYSGREVWTRDGTDVDTGTWRQVADLVSIENLIGTAGNDQMWGDSAVNILYGHAGDDRIDGREGNDILSGGFEREDDSRGGDGNDIIFGGAGNDVILVSYGTDTIDGGADFDTLSFDWVGGDLNVDLGLGTTTFRESGSWIGVNSGGGWSALVTTNWTSIENLIGGLGNDILTGNTADNRLAGGAGVDTYAFADGWGQDTVADFADGSERLDLRKVTGLFGIDQLAIEDTGAGAKITFAGNSITLTGVSAASLTDADFLFAEKPAGQVIVGTEGNDLLTGGLGDDQISGLAGSDVIVNADSGDAIDGGEGYDYVYAGAHTKNTGFDFTVAGSNVEYVVGNAGNDTIDASGNNGFIQSYGDAGDDTLIGGEGQDWMGGGTGSDTAVFAGNRADYTIVEDQGGWTGWTGITHNATGVIDWVISIEKLKFADVTIEAPGQRMQVIGDADADFLMAGGMSAEMYGLEGNDELTSGSGNDILYGGAGADRLAGGIGSDVLFIDNDDTLISGGDDFDYIYADESKGPIGLKANLAGTGVEYVFGGMGSDVIDASGASAFETVYGVGMDGNLGDDTFIGSAYADYFYGGDGNDTMAFAGTRADYAIETGGQGDAAWAKVTHAATGAVDWLYAVETAKFTDGSWALHP